MEIKVPEVDETVRSPTDALRFVTTMLVAIGTSFVVIDFPYVFGGLGPTSPRFLATRRAPGSRSQDWSSQRSCSSSRTAKGVKKVVGRGRPYDHDRSPNLRPATQTDGSLGYVSGHAAVSGTPAIVMGDGQPPAIAAALKAFSVIVGVTRICAGAHLPLDVAGGPALGILVGDDTNSIRSRLAGRPSFQLSGRFSFVSQEHLTACFVPDSEMNEHATNGCP